MRSLFTKRKMLVLMVVGVALLFTACGGSQEQAAQQEKNEKFGGTLLSTTTAGPKSFNPLLAEETSSNSILYFVFEGLTTTNGKTTEVEPCLAKSWEASEDKQTWTFHLREDVKWSDGEKFTAEDVVFTFDVIYDEDIPTSLRDVLTIDGEQIKVSKVDEYTVKMELPKPFAPFLRQLPDILPKHKLHEPWKNGNFKDAWGIDSKLTEIVGTGPVMIEEYKSGERVVLKRNPHYWKETDAGHKLPYLDRWAKTVVKSTETQVLKFENGESYYSRIPNQDYDRLKKKAEQEDFRLVNGGPGFGSNFVVFNQNPRNPNLEEEPWKLDWFTNLHFRRAVAHAVDRQQIIDQVFAGLGTPQWTPVSPQNKMFYHEDVKKYKYNLDKAREELKKGGFTWNDKDELVGPEGHKVKFKMVTNSGNKEREQILNIVTSDLEKLGMNINSTPIEFNKMVKQLTSQWNFDSILIGLTGSVEPNTGANVWKTSGNLHMWNPRQEEPATDWEAEINQLFAEGVTTLDQEKRQEIYKEWQEIVAQNVPVIYTVHADQTFAIRDELKNTEFTAYADTIWGEPVWNVDKLYLKK